MRFRNDREIRMLVPSLALELDPGEEADLPDPDVDEAAADAEPAPKKTKKQDVTPEPQPPEGEPADDTKENDQ